MQGSLVTQLLYLCVLKKNQCVCMCVYCVSVPWCVWKSEGISGMPSTLLRQGLFSCSPSSSCFSSVSPSSAVAALESLGLLFSSLLFLSPTLP